jgi:twitching motility protein PilT
MRRNELDYILGTMLDSNKDVSDLNITVDKPLQVESSGQLVPVSVQPPVEILTPFQT